MRRERHAGRAGFALLPVVLALALLGATAYLMTRETAMGGSLVSATQQHDRARYISEAALRHADWQVQGANCSGFSDIATTSFGGGSYVATVTPANGSPVTLSATGTLADGTSHTLRRKNARAYEAPQAVTLQLGVVAGQDAFTDSFYSARNHGGTSYLQVNSDPGWTQNPIIQFDLTSLPAGARVLSARLELMQRDVVVPGVASVHRITRDWVEGTQDGTGQADGATWHTHDGTNAWTQLGGDFESEPYAEEPVSAATNGQRKAWEVGALVQDWLAGRAANHGFLIRGDGILEEAEFHSQEASNPLDAPRLTVVHTCECGQVCGGASCGSLKPLLLVVSDAVDPTPQETARQTLMESWCYAVTLIDDDAESAKFAAEMALNDVIYISQEITTLTTVTKLRGATIGIVNEEYQIGSDLGLASGTGSGFYNDMNVVDDAHYMTSEFGLGALALFSPPYDVYTGAAFTLAPDLQVLGEAGSLSTLVALDAGGDLWDSGKAAGRRVQVPWGHDFSALNGDGRILMQRAIEWAAGAGCGSRQPVLLVVGDATLPLASRDAGRKELIESGCFTVSVIDDGDTQSNFDTAVAAADVVYASGTSSGPALLDKLTGIAKGVVNEVAGKLDNFGFSSSTSQQFSADTFAESDTAHYISSPFGGAAINALTTSLSMPVPGGTLAPGLQIPAGFTASDPGVVTLDTGAKRWDGNPAPARRVHLPFGPAETSQLTAGGETIVRRAIEWAAGNDAGGGGAPPTGGVVFEGFAEVNPSTTYDVDVPTPDGTVEGDLLIAAIASDEDATDLAAPAGWSPITLQANGTRVTLGVWWKLAAASEPATHHFTSSRYEMKYGWMMRFSGHDPANPINATSSFDTGSSKDPPVPSTTTTVDDTLILRIGGFDHQDITLDDPGLTGHTPITMDLGGSGLGACAGGAGYTYLAVAGPTGNAAFALTGKEEYVTGTIAIAPDPN